MICEPDGRALRRRNTAARLLVGASASTAFMWCHGPLPASADTEPTRTDATDHGHYGGGARNHNIFSMRSPTHNHGYQHTSTSTAGGSTSVQNGMCRQVRVCIINLKAAPRKAKTETPSKADALAPKKGAAKTLTSENTNPASPGLGFFFYFGASGFMMMVPASAT